MPGYAQVKGCRVNMTEYTQIYLSPWRQIKIQQDMTTSFIKTHTSLSCLLIPAFSLSNILIAMATPRSDIPSPMT